MDLDHFYWFGYLGITPFYPFSWILDSTISCNTKVENPEIQASILQLWQKWMHGIAPFGGIQTP